MWSSVELRQGRTFLTLADALRIGMYSRGAAGPHLFDIISAFHERHPACRVELIDTGFGRDQLDWLHTSDADVLVLRLPITSPDIAVGPVLSREGRVAL